MKVKGELDVVGVFWGFPYPLGNSLWLSWGPSG